MEKRGVMFAEKLECLRFLYGSPMDVFSSCLRGTILPTTGSQLYCADYNAIEARVLFWVADHKKGLQAFIRGEDQYCEMGTVIYGRTITKEDELERFLGKTVFLGAGYGLGFKKFFKSCKESGQPITIELAEKSIKAYRAKHYPVVQLWHNLESAVICAVKNPGKKFSVNHTTWFMKGKILWCELPSGRRLAYYDPKIKYKPTPWGENREAFYCWNVDPKTKQWVFTNMWYGQITENVVQAISRDIMVDAMLRIEHEKKYDVLLTVHDEIVAEKKNGNLEEFINTMAIVPKWGETIPVKVEGWAGDRYRK